MNKYFGFTVGLSLVGSMAFAGSTQSSIASGVDNVVSGQTSYMSGNLPSNPISGQQAGSNPYQAMFVTVPVPEPATLVVLATLAGGMIARKRKASRP